jgi:hypothetical protein
MRKIMLGMAPLLAVAAFAIAPAAASAVTTYGTCAAGPPHSANCPGTEDFTAFPEFEHVSVLSKKATGSGNFILENEAKTADIECSTFSDSGYVRNVVLVGHSVEFLVFDGCKGSGAFEKKCSAINAKNNNEIEGFVSNEVLTETTVKITIESGFNVKCLEKEGKKEEEELGNVTGTATGTQTKATNVLKFAKATGLKFAGEPATITGEDELETTSGKKVFI